MLPIQNIHFHRPSLKQIFVGSLGGSLGVLGVLLGVAAYIVETLTRPRQPENFADLYTFTPFELNLPAEEVTFPPSSGDHQVSGWYIPHVAASATVLVCPGYRGRRSDVLGMSGQLWKAGYNVLAFEYYGHGTVVGKPVTLGYREMNDFLGAVAYAKQRAPQTRLGAVGYSMGASIAIMATARTPEIKALVADSGFATHRSAIEYSVRRTMHMPFALFDWFTDLLLWLRAGYHFNQVEPLRDIGRIAPRPTLIIHGLKDTLVNPDDAKLLYAAANEPKELWLHPNADHCGIYFEDRAAYVERVIGFLDRSLKESQSPVQLQTSEINAQRTHLPEAS
ncbi:MAG: alpha/beta hydrolase [Ktedonobacteraceae bacterium]